MTLDANLASSLHEEDDAMLRSILESTSQMFFKPDQVRSLLQERPCSMATIACRCSEFSRLTMLPYNLSRADLALENCTPIDPVPKWCSYLLFCHVDASEC